MLHIASSLRENLRGARTRPRFAFHHAWAPFEHAHDLLSITPVPCSNIPLLRFQPHLRSVIKPARRRVHAAERPRTAPSHSLRAYRSYAHAPQNGPAPQNGHAPQNGPASHSSPSSQPASSSNSSVENLLQLHAAALRNYKLSVLGSSWGFP